MISSTQANRCKIPTSIPHCPVATSTMTKLIAKTEPTMAEIVECLDITWHTDLQKGGAHGSDSESVGRDPYRVTTVALDSRRGRFWKLSGVEDDITRKKSLINLLTFFVHGS